MSYDELTNYILDILNPEHPEMDDFRQSQKSPPDSSENDPKCDMDSIFVL